MLSIINVAASNDEFNRNLSSVIAFEKPYQITNFISENLVRNDSNTFTALSCDVQVPVVQILYLKKKKKSIVIEPLSCFGIFEGF